MTREEFEYLALERQNFRPLKVSALDGTTKTLILGYDVDRFTNHVFQHEKIIHVVTYDSDKNVIAHLQGEQLDARAVIPNKRIYPERSNFDFLLKIKELGFNFAMSPFDKNHVPTTDRSLFGLTDIPELDEDNSPTFQM